MLSGLFIVYLTSWLGIIIGVECRADLETFFHVGEHYFPDRDSDCGCGSYQHNLTMSYIEAADVTSAPFLLLTSPIGN